MFGDRTQAKKPILVTGGTGKTGARVVSRLRARGLEVRAGSRSGETVFDWSDRKTWDKALKGAGAAYIAFTPDLAVPGSVDAIDGFIRAAARQGVKRLVLLSGRGEEEARRCETLVRSSGLDWTIVRASWFAQNFSEAFFLEGILSGVLALPADGVREPFIDVDDIADVAAAALIEDYHVGQLYEVTGPRLMTFEEAVGEIAHATGRDLRFVNAPMDAFMDALKNQGLPDDMIWLIDYLFSTVLDGRNQSVTDGVERALGRKPRDFAGYARATAETGVWTPQAR